ncbi:hypothetical protein LguiB_020390 [Lonicera macranthoides]
MRTRAKRRCSCPVFQLWEVLISSTSVPASNGRPVVAIKTEIDDLFSQFVYKGGQWREKGMWVKEIKKAVEITLGNEGTETVALFSPPVSENLKMEKVASKRRRKDGKRVSKKVSEEVGLVVSPYFVKPAEEKAKTTVEIKQGFSAAQKLDEAYQRRSADNNWKPPRSHFNLLQEDHAHDRWRYAADAYAIFCTGKWERVRPTEPTIC